MKSNFNNIYYKFFKIAEIENSKTLQFLYFCISFSFFVTFYSWINSSAISISSYMFSSHVCPPYFQSCGQYFFLQDLPYGYSNGIFYVMLFLILGYGVISALKKNWREAHLALLIAWTWKIVWVFFLTYGAAGNYDYYDLVLGFVFLFMQNKLYFAKISFVFLYFLASTIKIDEGWIFGNYFNTLITGAPIISDSLVPFFTNLVILMQIVGTWFLLSNNKIIQKFVFLYFLLFHIYSGFIVNYRYISISIPALVIIFGYNFKFLSFIEKPEFKILKINRQTIFGYIFLFVLFIGQMIGILIPGNQKKTLEGNYWGVFMFEAAHQCVSNYSVEKIDSLANSTTRNFKNENHIANNRCDPYMYWYKLKSKCEKDSSIQKISWTFDHSINGHQYERIVDVEDACKLTYSTFSHNDWIKINDEPETLNSPVYKTGYHDYFNEKKSAQPTLPFINDALLNIIEKIYWLIWILIFLVVIIKITLTNFKKNN